MRGAPGRRDSQTFEPYLLVCPVEHKVGCHNLIVTDVTVKLCEARHATFRDAEHLMNIQQRHLFTEMEAYIHGRETGQE